MKLAFFQLFDVPEIDNKNIWGPIHLIMDIRN